MSTNVGEIDLSLILNSGKFDSQLKNVDSNANKASDKISSSLSKIGKAVAAAFSVAAIVKFGKECINVATETSNAWIGLNSILTGQGKSFVEARKFIEDYVGDGLVPLNNAVAAYKNLTLRGYNSNQIQKTMIALKNSATFARQSTYSLGDAVQTATEGLKNENSVVVDNAGVTKNVAKMWEEYAKSIGKTVNNLTQQEKIQAEVNGILEETKFQSNDAAIYSNTYSGMIAKLNTAFTMLKTAIGNVIQPIAKLFVPIITSAVNVVTRLFTALSGLLALFGLKADSVETVSNGIGNLANTAEDASDAISGIGDSAKKAGKDAKKASNNIAAFDNLNVLQKNDNSGNSESGSSGKTGGINESLNVSSIIKEDTSMFSGLLEKVKQLADIFKSGFNTGLGNINFDSLKANIFGIKETLKEIWSSPDVLKAAKNCMENFAFVLGQTSGAIARVGVNISEGLLGSIDVYLSKNKKRIKKFIINMFDITSKDLKLTGNFYQAIGEISDIFKSDTAKQIGADIIAIFDNPLMSSIEVCRKFISDIKGVFLQPIIDNSEKIKTAMEGALGRIQNITDTVASGLSKLGDRANSIYNEHLQPLFESFKTGISDTLGKFLDVYNQNISPALDRMSEKFKEVWNNSIQPLFEKIQDLCGSVADLIKVLWENQLKPLIDWIIENIVPVAVPIMEEIWNVFQGVIESIANGISTAIDVFKGIITFLINVFSRKLGKSMERY